MIVPTVERGLRPAERFPGAPYGLKMACGENPKRVYGCRARPRRAWATSPATARPGSGAEQYRREWDDYREKARQKGEGRQKDRTRTTSRRSATSPTETLAGVLDGEILVQNHCYRADEMAR